MPRYVRLFTTLPALALLCLGEPTTARVSERSSYSKTQTYSTALRFLRVDRGYAIVEKDAEASYLIFSYPISQGSEETSNGSVEVVELSDGVRLVVNLPRLPEYHERVLSDGIFNKLRREYGAPPPRKPRDKDKPNPDSDKRESDADDKPASPSPPGDSPKR